MFPKKTVRVLMFYPPTFDRRTELMIIYGKAVPDHSTVPISDDGVELGKNAPDAAHLYLEHARKDLVMVKR